MPLLRINAVENRPVLAGGGDLRPAVRWAAAALPPDAPVVVLIHGYRFSPFDRARSPHDHILSLRPARRCWKAISWPRHMGFGRGRADEGLCIAFGWDAQGSIWRAWDRAAAAGDALAEVIRLVRDARPGSVDVLSHSLGARVALSALGELPARSVGRVVLMAAAEFQGAAARALASPAGCAAEVINVTSRENDLFDKLLECAVRVPEGGKVALGAGLGRGAANWLDLQMDCPASRAALDELGYRIPPPVRRVCHWSAYLRPGLFVLYRDLIRRREALPLGLLRARLPDRHAGRWSRFLPLPGLPVPGLRKPLRGSQTG